MIVLQDKFKPCCLYGRHKSITGQLRSHRFSLQRHRHVFLTSVGRHYSWFRFSIEQALTMFGSSYSIKCFWLGYSYAEILDIYYSSDQKSPRFPSPPPTFFYHAWTLFSLLIYPYLKKNILSVCFSNISIKISTYRRRCLLSPFPNGACELLFWHPPLILLYPPLPKCQAAVLNRIFYTIF